MQFCQIPNSLKLIRKYVFDYIVPILTFFKEKP